MIQIDIPLVTLPLLTPERLHLRDSHLLPFGDTTAPFAMSCSIALDSNDTIEIAQDCDIWTLDDTDRVSLISLHQADLDQQMALGGLSYAIFSHPSMGLEIPELFAQMTDDPDDFNPATLMALQGGFIVMTKNPLLHILHEVEGDIEELTDEVIAKEIRAVVSTHSSQHQRLAFTQQVIAFLNAMLTQLRRDRDDEDFNAFYEGACFRVVPQG